MGYVGDGVVERPPVENRDDEAVERPPVETNVDD